MYAIPGTFITSCREAAGTASMAACVREIPWLCEASKELRAAKREAEWAGDWLNRTWTPLEWSRDTALCRQRLGLHLMEYIEVKAKIL